MDGIVHDQSGAVIPGASVTLRNEASGTELKAKTDNTGVYSIDLVPPATYTLTVQVTGFKTYSQSGLAVHPADRLNLPVWRFVIPEQAWTRQQNGVAWNRSSQPKESVARGLD